MKFFLITILISLLSGGGTLSVQQAHASSADHELLLQRAESLLQQYKDSEALRIYEEVLASSVDNFEALYKASLLHNRMGDRYTDYTRKGEHFKKAKDYALRAYVLKPEEAEANYVMALSLAHISLLSGPRQRLALKKEVKSYLDATLAIDDSHADAWHLLGRWQYKMANLNFAEVAASKFLFGGAPAGVSNEQAIMSIRKAIEHNPGNIKYYVDLASVYQQLKDREKCVTVLQSALALHLETKEELEISRRCRIMLDEQLQ